MSKYMLATIILTATVSLMLMFAFASLQQSNQVVEHYLYESDVLHQQGVNNLYDFILTPK
ncbi:hypothetical protein [Enterovibrio calviensis]|uniref:hypothetical protein n=1 Tax=Enterovibrio calviensis TaxID=91359 RepID=UPI0004829E72|nr:hypothetical protein [Enterovibrio calviensis]